MIQELLSATLAALLVGLLGYVLRLGARNRQKYQFFKQNAPGLKVLENPSLFGGHTNQIHYARYNLAKIEELLTKYGPTMGCYLGTRPTVITTDLDFIKVFTVDEQYHTNRIKANLPIKELEEDSILFAEDEQWLRLRKAIAPAFSAHKIKSPNVQSGINRIMDRFVDSIERRLDEAKDGNSIEVDAEDICHRYALAQVFTNFYKQDNVIDFHSEKDPYVEMIARGCKAFNGLIIEACAAFPSLKSVLNWLILNFHEQGTLRNTIMNYIKQQTKLNFEATKYAQSLKNDGQEQPLADAGNITLKDGSKFKRIMIDHITDQYREGKLTTNEYFHSTFNLFFAADTTVSDALSRLLYNLAYHQDVQDKLRTSILASGVDSEYLTWAIYETLRVCPVAASGCSRVIKRDIQTKHGLVPAGTYVVTPVYTISRLKEYWGEDAEEFKPERWANAKSFHPMQFLAFGGGRRACPGKELALMEIKMLLNVLMRKYKLEKSAIHTTDNSKLFTSPIFSFLIFDTPTYVRVSRLAC